MKNMRNLQTCKKELVPAWFEQGTLASNLGNQRADQLSQVCQLFGNGVSGIYTRRLLISSRSRQTSSSTFQIFEFSASAIARRYVPGYNQKSSTHKINKF